MIGEHILGVAGLRLHQTHLAHFFSHIKEVSVNKAWRTNEPRVRALGCSDVYSHSMSDTEVKCLLEFHTQARPTAGKESSCRHECGFYKHSPAIEGNCQK